MVKIISNKDRLHHLVKNDSKDRNIKDSLTRMILHCTCKDIDFLSLKDSRFFKIYM